VLAAHRHPTRIGSERKYKYGGLELLTRRGSHNCTLKYLIANELSLLREKNICIKCHLQGYTQSLNKLKPPHKSIPSITDALPPPKSKNAFPPQKCQSTAPPQMLLPMHANLISASNSQLAFWDPSSPRCRVHHLPLLIQPTLRRILSALQHHMVTLQPTREIVPGAGNKGVLACEVLDHGFICRLHIIHQWCSG
jgi:hypothetical protein